MGKKKLGVKQEILVSSVALLLAIMGWYFGLYQPVSAQTAELNGEIKGLQDSIRAIDKYRTQEKALRFSIAKLEEDISLWDQRFPPRSQIVALTTQIITFMENFDLSLIEVQPSLFDLYALERAGAHVAGSYVMQLPLTFKLHGRYLNMGKMLENLDELPFNLTIAEIEIDALKDKYPQVETRLRLFLYVHI